MSKGKSTGEKKEYKARFLKIRERKISEEKKPINLVLPVQLMQRMRQISILAGINKSCVSHIVANILEDHIHEYADVIQELFEDEGITPR
ncbi:MULTISPECIES: DUF3408 domain-containing protein [Bacteroides]|jgi:hypothetical protein|uniref:DUF3408 domain-containing protein n=1 Tax=Bacteroides TaxID=816 RepID=UPI002AFE669D|nr:DUF3408 domain-containing protein [Bacteroides sp. CG01]